MLALKKAFLASFSFRQWQNVPDPERFCAKPGPMTGFLGTLTDEQKKLALEYRGEDTHGGKAVAR